MNKWLKNRDINDYVIRQGESCDYLKKYFSTVIAPKISDDYGKRILDVLLKVHLRQRNDITKLIGVIPNIERKSFYFDNMIKDKTDLKTLLVVQYISYLRGKKRYNILKKHFNEDNLKFVGLWSRFYVDAEFNAERVLKYMKIKYGLKIYFMIWKYKIKEHILINLINKYNENKLG